MTSGSCNHDFKPVFNISHDVATFCAHYQVKTMLEFIEKYEPFNQVEIQKKDLELKRKNLGIEDCHKLSTIQNELFKSDAKFNDTETLENFKRLKEADTSIGTTKENVENYFQNNNEVINTELLSTALQSNDDALNSAPFIESSSLEQCNINNNNNINDVNRRIALNRGIKMKKIIRSNINKDENRNFIKDTSKSYDFTDFIISGKSDGIETVDVNKQILQIKTKNKVDVSKPISNREKIQVFCYMKINSCNSCYFTESGQDSKRKTTIINWDETFWEENIYKKLKEFTDKVRMLTIEEYKQRWEMVLKRS